MFINMWSLRVGLIMFFFPYRFPEFHIIASLPICRTLTMDVIVLLSNFFCNTIVFVEISENAGYVFFLFLSLFSYLGTNSIDVVGQENKIESTFLYI